MNKAIKLISVSKIYPHEKSSAKGLPAGIADFWALRDVSLEVVQGQILGIIGRNGAGKTTLLNIISGVLSSTEGEVSICGKVLGLFNLGIGFQDELTGRENIFLNGALLGASRSELELKLNAITDFSELGDFINMPLGTYSQGMRLRLGFGIVANLDFDILVIDEVLAVGDALFQSKCFQRLMDFKRAGKTLIITTQSMDLIERLCDRALLLDHGRLLFCGDNQEAINRYRMLLNTEKFFVGSAKNVSTLVEDTKKWADDISEWGSRLGTREAEIDSVQFINKWGLKCDSVKSREPLKIRVRFLAKNKIKEPHFGVAIFRNDGVYCYGPNTVFDGHYVPELKPGRHAFSISYRALNLAPGEYRVSIAIWDRAEIVPYDYHEACYRLQIVGYRNINNALFDMPISISGNNFLARMFSLSQRNMHKLQLTDISYLWGKRIDDAQFLDSLVFIDSNSRETDTFFTNDPAGIMVNLKRKVTFSSDVLLWAGIYRDDGVYCCGMAIPAGDKTRFSLRFPIFRLLPGRYCISVVLWDNAKKTFLMCDHGRHMFRVVFDREDHGTVYIPHRWRLQYGK